MRKFREETRGLKGPKPLRGTITKDRDRPGHYLSIIEFASYEAAMEASNRSETQEFFGRLSKLLDGPPKFYNLHVVDTWEMGPSEPSTGGMFLMAGTTPHLVRWIYRRSGRGIAEPVR